MIYSFPINYSIGPHCSKTGHKGGREGFEGGGGGVLCRFLSYLITSNNLSPSSGFNRFLGLCHGKHATHGSQLIFQ